MAKFNSYEQDRIVLDLNVLRKSDQVDDAASNARARGGRLLIVDTAVYEMGSVADPELTFRRNFQALIPHLDLVDIGRGHGALMRQERKSKRPCPFEIDSDLSARLRNLLGAYKANDHDTIDAFLCKVKQVAPKEIAKREKPGQAKSYVHSMVRALKASLSEAEQKQIRNRSDGACADEAIVRVLAGGHHVWPCSAALQKHMKFSEEVALNFALSDAVAARVFLANLALALDWFSHGGLESKDQSAVQNDMFDLDYVVAATYAGKLLSNDDRANRVFQSLVHALERRQDVLNALPGYSLNQWPCFDLNQPSE